MNSIKKNNGKEKSFDCPKNWIKRRFITVLGSYADPLPFDKNGESCAYWYRSAKRTNTSKNK